MTHDLKIDPEYFDDVAAGHKAFELRRADRPYAVGDTLRLREFGRLPEHPAQGYTGRECRVRVNYILRDVPGFGLADGFCLLSITPVV